MLHGDYSHVRSVSPWSCQVGTYKLHIYLILQVKLSYLEVGHTHEDYNTIIGTIAAHIANLDLHTFDDNKSQRSQLQSSRS
jgi:hypothetical protein